VSPKSSISEGTPRHAIGREARRPRRQPVAEFSGQSATGTEKANPTALDARAFASRLIGI
jgi:hypothetical protein